jgi:hypothetical protein
MKKSFGKKLLALMLAGMLSFGAVPEEALGKVVGGALAKLLYIVPQSTLMNAYADSDHPDSAKYDWDGYTRVTAIRLTWESDSYSDTSESEITTNISVIPTRAATCTTTGEKKYIGIFSSTWAGVSTPKYRTIPALGHNWGETEYTWDEKYTSVTANRVCQRDESHVEEETADTVSSEVVKKATCEEKGIIKYTSAAFENKGFEVQSIEVETDALGHDWGKPEYTWSEDNKTVTASRVCKTDAEHIETETVNATSEVITDADCENKGETVYTSDKFENEAFEIQTKTVYTDALGHDLEKVEEKSATTTEEGNIEYYICKRCGKIFRDKEGKQEISKGDTIILRIRVPGDVNLDGSTDIRDVVLMKQVLANWKIEGTFYEPNANIDGDDDFDLTDVVKYKQFIAKWKGAKLV